MTHPFEPLNRQPSLRDDIVQKLLATIFSRSVKSGDRLVAQTFADQLGVSATPVREALVELASVGLIQILPNRGAVCLPFGAHELREIYHLRRILEVEATRLACGSLPVTALRDLRAGLVGLTQRKTRDWSQQAIQLDTRLHHLIAVGCGSVRLRYEIDRYQNLMQTIRKVMGDQNHVQHQAVEQHLNIIDALIDTDAEKACREMARHIDQTASTVEHAVFQSHKTDPAIDHAV